MRSFKALLVASYGRHYLARAIDDDQKFVTASWFATETEKHNIILKLLGETEDNKAIREPITVKHKQKCNTCGHTNKATAKYCGECGTALEIFA